MGIPYSTNLPPDLQALKEEIEGYARDFGLDFYETIFEVLDGEDLNEVAAYGGFPTRYPHWSFGMAFEELKKGYDYGLSKIYEMVINNDPCYAYLMRSNHTIDQKLVMAHVYGHCLAPETLVETVTGPKPITEVKVGDYVLTHRGRFRPVRVCARRWYKGRMCHLRVDGSREPVRITPEHPVLAMRPIHRFNRWKNRVELLHYRTDWVPAGEVNYGTTLVLPSLALAAAVDRNPQTVGGNNDFDFRQVLEAWDKEYSGYVFNFSVGEDESYTVGDGMVVHNCDFFKNNAYFAHTSRKMMDEMANHGVRLRRYVEKYGEDEVEAFIDRCMSIDDLIDIHSTAIRRREEVSRYDFKEQEDETRKLTRFKSKDYMEDYINPRAALKAEEEEHKRQRDQAARNFPERPEKDILLFLIEHAPLKPWQRDVLSIIRDEAYYFAPQGQTKVLNEGWASYWHSTIMTQKALSPAELIDYADHHSGTMATQRGRINPYKLGIELLRDIEHRWNTGKFGKEYDDCDDVEARRKWDRKLGLGRKKIFEVRRVHNDITFIDTFLTPEFCQEHKMFSFAYNDQGGQYVIESREFEKVKKRLLFSLTNFGKPWIYVVDGNYRNRGELLLRHEHNGIDLRLDQASDTLANVQAIWGRPVHLQTVIEDKPSLLSCDGADHSIKTLGDADDPRKHGSGKTH